MGRGPKKHLKRLHAPKKWMLNKLGGSYAPRPSTGPHKLRECLPIVVLLRNRLKYALSRSETVAILKNRNIQVDGKVRTDLRYPTGFQDVVTIEKTNENFRILYDHKGRFVVHRITPEEAKYKLCKVKKLYLAANGVPTITTHDGRTIRYPNPDVREGDTIKLDIASGKMTDFIRFDVGNMVFVNGGRNTGRIGTILHREKHEGSFEIIHLKDAAGKEFATRAGYCFVVGKGKREYISLPKHRGVHMSPVDELEARLAKKN